MTKPQSRVFLNASADAIDATYLHASRCNLGERTLKNFTGYLLISVLAWPHNHRGRSELMRAWTHCPASFLEDGHTCIEGKQAMGSRRWCKRWSPVWLPEYRKCQYLLTICPLEEKCILKKTIPERNSQLSSSLSDIYWLDEQFTCLASVSSWFF